MANKYNEKQVDIMTKTERFPARLVHTLNNHLRSLSEKCNHVPLPRS
ncbi:hypothetical protein SAMN05216502_11164 [Citrobacter amalonaticus]|nr:hypothetical protein SAMN05216502_11164 [Citrobacter amalonaticus]